MRGLIFSGERDPARNRQRLNQPFEHPKLTAHSSNSTMSSRGYKPRQQRNNKAENAFSLRDMVKDAMNLTDQEAEAFCTKYNNDPTIIEEAMNAEFDGE